MDNKKEAINLCESAFELEKYLDNFDVQFS